MKCRRCGVEASIIDFQRGLGWCYDHLPSEATEHREDQAMRTDAGLRSLRRRVSVE